jgi:hypothetical protein
MLNVSRIRGNRSYFPNLMVGGTFVKLPNVYAAASVWGPLRIDSCPRKISDPSAEVPAAEMTGYSNDSSDAMTLG